MQIPVQISGRGHVLTADQEQRIQAEVAKLERCYDRLTGCEVVVSVPNRRLDGEPVAYSIRLALPVPGGRLAITRQAQPSFGAAVNDAFDAARRRLQDYAHELRHDVKTPAPAARGRVCRLFGYEGYGFIATPDGREVYFHRNSVLEPGFEQLTEGMEVRFAEEVGEKGPQASTVTAASA